MRAAVIQRLRDDEDLMLVPNQRAPRRFQRSPLMNLDVPALVRKVRGGINAMPREPGLTKG